jgi:hypothetical protein
MKRSVRFLLVTSICSISAIVAPLNAQSAQQGADSIVTPTDSTPRAQRGPTLAGARVAVSGPTQSVGMSTKRDALTPVPLPAPPSRSRSTSYMVVGGAAFLAGAVIGDTAGTAFMVGGAILGLYGLFTFLN